MAQTMQSPDIVGPREIAEWWPHVILATASALLLTLLVVTLYYANSARRLLTDLQQYAWQVDKVDALLIQLLNAETGAWGFLVTGDSAYLEPYREGVTNMGTILDDIDKQADRSPLNREEYARLRGLIDAELTMLSEAIDARSAQRDPPGKVLESGRRMMEEIRDSLNTIKSQLSTESATYFVTSLSFLGKSRWVVVSLFTGAFTLLLGLFVLMQKQIRLRQSIASMMGSEKERLEKLVQKRTVELNDLAAYLTRVSEAEKRHVAQELHDEMGALLTAARMDTTWIIRDLDAELKEKYAKRLDRLSSSLDAAISLKRKITTDLKPPLLQELGLVESLRAMVEDLAADSAYEVRIDLPDSLPPLDEERTLAIFRIVQESLTNIRKYANARRIEISIATVDGEISVRVSDDGQGFDSDTLKHGGHGISGMRHRAQMFGGRVRVKSTPGKGTVVRARIPVEA